MLCVFFTFSPRISFSFFFACLSIFTVRQADESVKIWMDTRCVSVLICWNTSILRLYTPSHQYPVSTIAHIYISLSEPFACLLRSPPSIFPVHNTFSVYFPHIRMVSLACIRANINVLSAILYRVFSRALSLSLSLSLSFYHSLFAKTFGTCEYCTP